MNSLVNKEVPNVQVKEIEPTSVIELSESALAGNLNFLYDLIPSDCQLSLVVKGNAYGHGISAYVPLAEKHGVGHFSVFNAHEAYAVKKVVNADTDIMIMGMIADGDQLEWAIEMGISFYVFDIERLHAALERSQKVGKKARVHLQLETGMNRTGLSRDQLKQAVTLIRKYPERMEVCGTCTHYAGAESITNYLRIQNQMKEFKKLVRWLKERKMHTGMHHTACSAATITYPETHMQMVRIGILQYGFWPSRETLIQYLNLNKERKDPLKRVLSWKTMVMSIKEVKAGSFIGYGTTYLAENDMKIAAVPIGYADGYSRSLSNQGRILIHGQRVSVVGIVNMNMLTVDVSCLDNVQPGDEAILIGEQKDMNISVASFSELSSQLNYELLTRLPKDIPRIVTN